MGTETLGAASPRSVTSRTARLCYPHSVRLVFDRGTFALVDPPAKARLDDMPGVVWDPRDRRFRAPAYRAIELVRALRAQGVPLSAAAARRGAVPALTPPSLRSYQEAAADAWELAGRRGVVVLPTGSGKTRVALAILARLRVPTLCLVPTRVLLHQWQRQLAQLCDAPIGALGDGTRDVQAITVATYESAYRHMSRIGDRFRLLVVDEAHHFGSGVRDEALEMCAAPFRLGLTATPNEAPLAVAGVERLIGPVVYRKCMADLAGTHLAPFDIVRIEVTLSSSEQRRYAANDAAFRDVHAMFRQLHPDATWAAFMAHASRTAAGRRALAAWHRNRHLLAYTQAKSAVLTRLLQRHRQARVLIFTATNIAAYAIAREHLVMPITCDIPRTERDRALAAFRDGTLLRLVSAQVLNEGLDVPDAEVGVVLGSSLGTREYVQRVGRVLRPHPGKRATVYEVVCGGTREVAAADRRRRGLAS